MATKRITVPSILEAPTRGDRLVVVTAYDCPQGKTADVAGADMILVGDSLAMVVLGHPDTLSVTLDEMIHHTRAVRRGVERALLVADMPFGSFHLGPEQAVASAIRFVKEAGAQAVKIEGGRPEVVAALVRAEVPVMAHLGLTPQSVHRLGGYKVQGRSDEAARKIVDSALELEDAGAFSLVLECVPSDLGAEISDRLAIPTIGIGAGAACDGQVLVYHDLLGLEERIAPRFVRRYAELGLASREAIERFAADVRAGRFPSPEETYGSLEPKPELRKIYG